MLEMKEKLEKLKNFDYEIELSNDKLTIKDFVFWDNMGVLETVAGFQCLNGEYSQNEVARTLYGTKKDRDDVILNALSWYTAEEVSRSYCDILENEGLM